VENNRMQETRGFIQVQASMRIETSTPSTLPFIG
jgi:hypothetical protein